MTWVTPVDVDAARGDVGRDQHVDLAVAESAQGLLARALPEVAMDGRRRESARDELVGEALGLPLGLAEDHRQAAALGLQNACDDLVLVQRVGTVDELSRGRHGLGLVGRLRADVQRMAHVAAGEGDHGRRHGGREQHRLAQFGGQPDDPLDVGQKAQVEHLVGLVQHEHLDVAEVQVPLTSQVEQAAGGTDDDVDASAQFLDLGFVRATPVDGQDPHSPDGGRGFQVGRHLDGELTGGDDDQRLGLARCGGLVVLAVGRGDDALQQRHAEGEGLASAGAGLADQVAAHERDREGHLLDGEGLGDADALERVGDGVQDAKVPEGGQGVSPLRSSGSSSDRRSSPHRGARLTVVAGASPRAARTPGVSSRGARFARTPCIQRQLYREDRQNPR